MAWGFENLETETREFECISVLHGAEFIFGLGLCAEPDICAAAVAQLEVSGEKVGVEVSEKDMADLNAELRGIVDVFLDVALGIDHDCRCAVFVGDEVGRMGEAAKVVLFEKHESH